jgi:hypothetical protein
MLNWYFAVYSDEDKDFTRKKPRHRYSEKAKSKFKNRRPEYDRRKRSVNTTEDNKNAINTTFTDSHVDDKERNTTVTVTEPFGDFNATTEPYRMFSAKSQRLSFLTKTMRPRFLTGFTDNDEVGSDEEDFSSNLKKRSPRRKKINQKVRPAETGKWKFLHKT